MRMNLRSGEEGAKAEKVQRERNRGRSRQGHDQL